MARYIALGDAPTLSLYVASPNWNQLMARGDLIKKLFASYGRDSDFRAVAELIVAEEEKKGNTVLARALRKQLEAAASRQNERASQLGPRPPGEMPKGLAPLIPFPDAAADFVERIEPR